MPARQVARSRSARSQGLAQFQDRKLTAKDGSFGEGGLND